MQTLLLLKDSPSNDLNAVEVIPALSTEKALKIAALKMTQAICEKYWPLLIEETWCTDNLDDVLVDGEFSEDNNRNDAQSSLCLGILESDSKFSERLLEWLSDVDEDFCYSLKQLPSEHLYEQIVDNDQIVDWNQIPNASVAVVDHMLMPNWHGAIPDSTIDDVSLLDETFFEASMVDDELNKFSYDFTLRHILNANYRPDSDHWIVDGVPVAMKHLQ